MARPERSTSPRYINPARLPRASKASFKGSNDAMAFSGLIATPGYVGGDKAGQGGGPVFYPAGTSISPSSGTSTVIPISGAPFDGLQPCIRLYASADSYVSVGDAPDSNTD